MWSLLNLRNLKMPEGSRWRGKLLTEYTKDELIGIINKLFNSYERRIASLTKALHIRGRKNET